MRPPAVANEAAPIDERDPLVLGCAPSHGVGICAARKLAPDVDFS